MTLIMGVVNVTTDSFSDGGRYLDTAAAIAHGRSLVTEGADMIDIGGESTRPGAQRVTADVEQQRVLPVVQAVAATGVTVSIDTMNADTAVKAITAGASIVNDVSGGKADPDMFSAIAGTSAQIVLQHWRDFSARMYASADYDNTVAEVTAELYERTEAAQASGITADRVIIDPGIGFSKNAEHNWQMLRALPNCVALGFRVLVGTSRKRFLRELLGADSVERRLDQATAVTSVLAAQTGVWAVRVHNVAATRDALMIAQRWAEG